MTVTAAQLVTEMDSRYVNENQKIDAIDKTRKDTTKVPTEKAIVSELDKLGITITETTPTGYLKGYEFKQGTTTIGTVNIPLDFVIKSAEKKVSTGTGDPSGLPKDTPYIDLEINVKSGTATSSHIYVDLSNIGKIYTFTDTARIDFTEDTSGNVSADIKEGSVNTVYITDSAVTTAKLDDDSVTTAKIVDANVTTDKIADANVTTIKIADANVTTAKLAADAVTNAKLADDAVQTENIKDANVTLAKLAADSVNSSKIVDASIVSSDVAKDTITGGDAANKGNLAADTVHEYNINDDVKQDIIDIITNAIQTA